MKYYKKKYGVNTEFYEKNDNNEVTVLKFFNDKFKSSEVLTGEFTLIDLLPIKEKEYKEALKNVFKSLADIYKIDKSDKIDYLNKINELQERENDLNIENSFISEKLDKVSKASLQLFTKIETFIQLYGELHEDSNRDSLVYSFSKLIRLEKSNIESLVNIDSSDDLPF